MSEHLPVMAAEVVEFLVTRTNGGYVDCTVGAGGHARFILSNAPGGKLLGLDLDAQALAKARTELAAFGERVALVKGNFSDLASIADEHGFHDVDGVLFDLGFSSMQLDDPSRGFSYQSEGPIDMRLDAESATTANVLLRHVSERDLAQIIFDYGEEKRARPIARSIVRARENGKLMTTSDLTAAVMATKPKQKNKTLSRVFQALRIAVNGELDNLRSGLAQAVDVLRPGGRVVVISYHSLEDRIVKRHFVDCENPCTCPRDLPECACGKKPTLKIVTRKIIRPRYAEVESNPRARSGKLRVAEKLETTN
ncbi:MAG: 16S rRNA (cytosine(1402)-N(4))-methyltransferase RsmH [Candidatus Eisenbacteria bacterium]